MFDLCYHAVMDIELKIKTAAEYREAEDAIEAAVHESLTSKAVEFINETIVPTIDTHIANRNKHKGVSLKAPVYPVAPFIAELNRLLNGKGFRITESHDGGGMYATIEVEWGVPKDLEPVVVRKIGRRYMGPA